MNPRRRLMFRNRRKDKSQPSSEAIQTEIVVSPPPILSNVKPKTSKATKSTRSRKSARKKTSEAPKE